VASLTWLQIDSRLSTTYTRCFTLCALCSVLCALLPARDECARLVPAEPTPTQHAVNFIARTLHFEHPDLTIFTISPGWVDT
jgi:hypothetical protein